MSLSHLDKTSISLVRYDHLKIGYDYDGAAAGWPHYDMLHT